MFNMSTHQLQIEWQPQPIEVKGNLNKALIIQDLLALIAQTIRVPTSPKEEKVKCGPSSVENFWFLFQDLMKEEFNSQLGTIQDKNRPAQGMEAVKTAVWFKLGICIPPWIEGSSGLPDLPWFGNAILGKGYAVTAIVYSVALLHAG